MRIALTLVVLAFIVMPRVSAAPINNPTEPAPEVQALPEQSKQTDRNANVEEEQKPVEPERPPEKVVEQKIPTGGKYDLLKAAGIPERDWSHVDYIISSESSWRHQVWNMDGSGAYGLCQSLPASKMASAGEDYMTNPVTQLRWCHEYAASRYGGWDKAEQFWRTYSWW